MMLQAVAAAEAILSGKPVLPSVLGRAAALNEEPERAA
jgi:hypothetical protein